MRVRPWLIVLLFTLWLSPAVQAGEADPPTARRSADETWHPSKEDLRSWYKPVRVHGTPFYDRLGAARWQGLRRAAVDGQPRLLLELRILGALDGAT